MGNPLRIAHKFFATNGPNFHEGGKRQDMDNHQRIWQKSRVCDEFVKPKSDFIG